MRGLTPYSLRSTAVRKMTLRIPGSVPSFFMLQHFQTERRTRANLRAKSISGGKHMSSWRRLSFCLLTALAVSTFVHAQQAPQPAPAGDVVGVGNFAHIVADVDKSLGFYRDVLGLTVSGTIPFG